MNSTAHPSNELILRDKLRNDPADWQSRRSLAHLLYDKQDYERAADIVWDAEEIPSNDIDLAFAARILAKARPRRAIRLLTAVLELNRGKAVQNLGMANALLHHGMVLQAARFYGAALEVDPTLANPDLEHFVLWTDDEQTLWGGFKDRRPPLGDLPWMVRDAKEARSLHSHLSRHTTPVHVPKLQKAPGEDLRHPLYQQEAKLNARITPPPAVTIPIDRVDPKHRRFDEAYGAEVSGTESVAPTGQIPVPPQFSQPVVKPPSAVPLSRMPPPSPDAPPRKTTVLPIVFPPPQTSSLKVPAPAEPAKEAALPQLPPAGAPRNRLLAPAVNSDDKAPAASPEDGA